MDTRTLRKVVLAAGLLGTTVLPAQADRFVLVLEGQGGSVAVELGGNEVYWAPPPCAYGPPPCHRRPACTVVCGTAVVLGKWVGASAHHRDERCDERGWDRGRRGQGPRGEGRPGWGADGRRDNRSSGPGVDRGSAPAGSRNGGRSNGRGNGRGGEHGTSSGWKTHRANW